jgi:hypothetical protein
MGLSLDNGWHKDLVKIAKDLLMITFGLRSSLKSILKQSLTEGRVNERTFREISTRNNDIVKLRSGTKCPARRRDIPVDGITHHAMCLRKFQVCPCGDIYGVMKLHNA